MSAYFFARLPRHPLTAIVRFKHERIANNAPHQPTHPRLPQRPLIAAHFNGLGHCRRFLAIYRSSKKT